MDAQRVRRPLPGLTMLRNLRDFAFIAATLAAVILIFTDRDTSSWVGAGASFVGIVAVSTLRSWFERRRRR